MIARALTPEEITLVLNQMPRLRDKTLFILLVRTGFRISELLSITLKDIKPDSLTVHRQNMKGKGKSRTIPLHPEAKDYLIRYITNLDHNSINLFKISRIHAWRVIKRAAIKAGLQGCISPHSGRKTFGMRVYTLTGKDLKAAQMALGHVSIQSTGHYLSIGQDEVNKAILAV